MKNKNNLRDSIDENYLFGEVKMWYEARKTKQEVGVIVEAKADEILFRKLLNHNCLFFAAQGWAKVVSLLLEAQKHKIETVIGIIDADFKRISENSLPENLFLTDFHDKEIMLVHSEAWNNVLNQFYDTKKLAHFEQQKKKKLLPFLLELIKPLSILRFLKEKHNLTWVFRTQKAEKYEYIKYKDFIEADTLVLNQEKLLSALENKSNLPLFFKNNPIYVKELAELAQNDIDLREWSNGHDLMNVVSLALEKAIGNKASSHIIAGEELEKIFSAAYRISDFEQTNLYLTLQIWQNTHLTWKILT